MSGKLIKGDFLLYSSIDVSILEEVFDSVKEISDRVQIDIRKSGIKLLARDNAQIIQAEIWLSNSLFEEYKARVCWVTVPINQICENLKENGSYKDKIGFTITPNYLTIWYEDEILDIEVKSLERQLKVIVPDVLSKFPKDYLLNLINAQKEDNVELLLQMNGPVGIQKAKYKDEMEIRLYMAPIDTELNSHEPGKSDLEAVDWGLQDEIDSEVEE